MSSPYFISIVFLRLSVYIGVGGILFDEFAAWSYVFAHEHGEDVVGACGVFDGHLF